MTAFDDPSLDDMVLMATGISEQSTLDVMAGMVLQCARQGKTIKQTMDALGFDRPMTHRIIQQLVGAQLINVNPGKHEVKDKPKAPLSSKPTASEKKQTTSGTVFSTALLEAVEKQYARCKKQNFYDLLEIEPDTPRAEMRTRYFALSKRFHPDKVFGDIPPDVKRKMSFVFQALTNAYDTLSNPKRRAEYNDTISAELELRAIEKKLKQAVRESAPPEPTRTDGAPATTAPPRSAPRSDPTPAVGSKPPPTPSGSTTPSAGVPPRSARSSFVNPLKKQGGDSIPAARPSGKPFVPSKPPSPAADQRHARIRRQRAGRAIQDLLSRRPPNPAPSVPPTDDLLQQAGRALEQGQIPTAVHMLKQVLKLDPSHEMAQEMLAAANEANNRAQAQQHVRRGRFAKNEGGIDEAKWHFEQALALEKNNIDARHCLAEALLDSRSDLPRALALMKEVIVLGGQKARYYATLGEIFLLAKETDRAQDAFQKAIRLDPENRDLKKRLKLCKK